MKNCLFKKLDMFSATFSIYFTMFSPYIEMLFYGTYTLLKDIQHSQNHYFKLVDVKVDKNVMVPWEPLVFLPI